MLNYGLGVVGLEMDMDFGGERAAHGQPTTRFGAVKNSLDCSWTKIVHMKLLVCCFFT